MGCFDSVSIRCPNCGAKVEFQSKAGACRFYEYDEDEVPIEVAADINGDTEKCPKCGIEVKALSLTPINNVPMIGRKVYED